ncbi:hypothetical protein PHYBLDRAFT_78266 [Phycomyces blakesleeanus NRRL 1555(-)]|uniref:SH3 domain-containing protein n=1 Tax=Phycomyces blakesleeanus (strain ATCC 8743b / DSM 1359 / FGSC 10004 / NBRC 33097 / NRRL 1555) TaxID=763407 RepID=A0A163AH12_PHYB8|nr:hypothetical protein PHYBLDRAFT_78266 [Phycomyces blakesleeanus NRRL 1555(-)]OAD73431.1 hypothetical protein PHYBLDRAFT_78266 [Phycomyces blakesleeanus NRRL 1555(-)]|eukprot:XP_018291471.1 hypothetical protein PHYBLDRAFT_78266 [Phycomyces blakesleeanus NRRL 1555(-)]
MYLIALILYLLIPLSNGQQCLSLANSTACPAFTNYYVSIGQASFVTYPWLANVTSIADFDLGLLSYINSSAPWQPLGCNGHVYPRFAATVTCSKLVLDYSSSLPCNLENNVLPKLLCRSTCTSNVNSILSLIQTKAVTCIGDEDGYQQILQNQRTACESTGEQSTCLDGLVNEGGCGFQNDQKSMCSYCQTVNTTLDCCKGLQCKSAADISRTHRNKLIGIIVGVLGGLLLLGLTILIWWWCFWGKKKKSQKKKKPRQGYSQAESYDMVPPTEPLGDEPPIDTWSGVPGQPGVIPAAAVMAKNNQNNIIINNSNTASNPSNINSNRNSNSNNSNTDGEIEGVSKVQTYLEGFCQVIYSKEPQHEDEILITQGDIIRMYYYFDDGWALGDNLMTCERGLFPLLCVVTMDPTEINAIFAMAELQIPQDTIPCDDQDASSEGSYRLTTSGVQKLRRSATLTNTRTPQPPEEQNILLPQRSASMHSRFRAARSSLELQRCSGEHSSSWSEIAPTASNSRTFLNNY